MIWLIRPLHACSRHLFILQHWARLLQFGLESVPNPVCLGLYQREQKIICLFPEYHIFDYMNLVFTWCLSSIISCASSSSSENLWSAWEASHPSAILNFYLCPVFSIANAKQRRPGKDRYHKKEREVCILHPKKVNITSLHFNLCLASTSTLGF